MGAARDRFAVEILTFEAMKDNWLAAGADGKWVVVLGNRAVGPYSRSDEAWTAGIEAFGRPGFLLRRIARVERPALVSQVGLQPRHEE